MSGHHHISTDQKLKWVFLINLAFTVLEFVGGAWINSVAIISDAIHDLGDTLAIGLAWYLGRYALKKADEKYPFGYRRYSLLAALINSLVLIVGAVLIFIEVIQRLQSPEMPNAEGMMYFAIFGVLFNGVSAWLLHGSKSMNEKVLTWHLLEDVMGWMAVLVVSLVLKYYHLPILDPILSLLIMLIIVIGVAKRLRESILVFLQKSPQTISFNEVETLLEASPVEVKLIELKEWSLDGEYSILDIHVSMAVNESVSQILILRRFIKEALKDNKIEDIHIEIVASF